MGSDAALAAKPSPMLMTSMLTRVGACCPQYQMKNPNHGNPTGAAMPPPTQTM